MWIVPARCEVSPLWITIREDAFFCLQQSSKPNGFLGNVFGTLHAMFDVRQEPLRILLKPSPKPLLPGDEAKTIAVASDMREVDALWLHLQNLVVPRIRAAVSELHKGSPRVGAVIGTHNSEADVITSGSMSSVDLFNSAGSLIPVDSNVKAGHHSLVDDADDGLESLPIPESPPMSTFSQSSNLASENSVSTAFVIDKIVAEDIGKALSLQNMKNTDEIAHDERFRRTARAFRQTFALSDRERLVAYYSCSAQGSLMNRGWLYLSENFLGFYSFVLGRETKILLEMKSISDITRERSRRTLLPDALVVKTNDGHEFRFGQLFSRDEVYAVLHSLVSRSLQRIIRLHGASDAHEASRESAVFANENINSPAAHGITMRETMAREDRDAALQTLFHLPDASERLIVGVWSRMWCTESAVADVAASALDAPRGRLYITNRYLLHIAVLPESDASTGIIRMVIPLCAISRISRHTLYSDEPDAPYAITIAFAEVLNVQSPFIFSVGDSLEKCDLFVKNLRGALSSASDGVHARLKQYTEARETNEATGLGELWGYPDSGSDLQQQYDTYFSAHGCMLALVRTPDLNHLVKLGISNFLRGRVWEMLCGAIFNRLFNAAAFIEAVESIPNVNPLVLDEIERDLTRSLPEYAAYSNSVPSGSGNTTERQICLPDPCNTDIGASLENVETISAKEPPGITALRRVLCAYAWYDPELGYCQAMNMVASVLLVYCSEQQSFWILRHLCSVALPGYFSPTMWGSVLDQHVLEVLVQLHLPQMSAALARNNVQLSVATMPWLLTVFIGALPLEFAVRILDFLFSQGSPVIFQFALAVLAKNEDLISSVSDETELVHLLRNYFARLDEESFAKLLDSAIGVFAPGVTLETVATLRQEHQLRVIRGIEDFNRKTAVREACDNVGRTSLSRAEIALVYDAYSSIMFYTAQPPASHSRGIDFDAYVQLLSALTRWDFFGGPIAEDQEKQRVLSSARGTKINESRAVVRFSKYLFEIYGRRRRGRISFGEVVLLLASLLDASYSDRARLVFNAFCTADDALGYDNLVMATELLLEISANTPESAPGIPSRPPSPESSSTAEQDVAGLTRILKLASGKDFLTRSEFYVLIADCPSAVALLSPDGFWSTITFRRSDVASTVSPAVLKNESSFLRGIFSTIGGVLSDIASTGQSGEFTGNASESSISLSLDPSLEAAAKVASGFSQKH